MTQQYQHIEYSYGVTILKMTPKMRKRWKAIQAEWDATIERHMKPIYKHPLFLPPFVKEKR